MIWYQSTMSKDNTCPRCGYKEGIENLTLVPFYKEKISPGQTLEIPVKPQVGITPLRLVIDPEIAPYFTLLDIKVGRNSQVATSGEMSATLFPPVPADKVQIYNIAGLDRMMVGLTVSLVVKNNDTSPRNFSAIIYAHTFYGHE